MKKIGILTYYRGSNAGTFLQAYGMLQALKERFPRDHVELIDFSYNRRMFPLSKDRTTLARWRSLWGRIQTGRKRSRKYQIARREFLTLSNRSLVTDDSHEALRFIEDGHYDLIVVGSDTVLEMPRARCVNDEPSVYWLPEKTNSLKVACSVSGGNTRLDHLSPTLKDRMTAAIRDFYLVGVRDSMTWEMIQALGVPNERLYRVPDPTFALTLGDTQFEKIMEENQIDPSRSLIGIDIHENIPLCRELIRHYRSKGFTVISPRYNRYADYSLALSPFEWAGMFKYLSLFITCHFHGAVFSLKNNVPLLAIEYDDRIYDCHGESKITCLLTNYNIYPECHFNLQMQRDTSQIIQRAMSIVRGWDVEHISRKNMSMRNEFESFVTQMNTL